LLIQLYIDKDNIGPFDYCLSHHVALDGKMLQSSDPHTNGVIQTAKLTEEIISPYSEGNYAVIGKGIKQSMLKRYTFYEGKSKIC
jgi:hypothetical protein